MMVDKIRLLSEILTDFIRSKFRIMPWFLVCDVAFECSCGGDYRSVMLHSPIWRAVTSHQVPTPEFLIVELFQFFAIACIEKEENFFLYGLYCCPVIAFT